MKRLSEAEVNSCTRKFLLKNEFNFLSTKNNGEKFYFRIDDSTPPLFKQPDCVAYKENVVIIWEEKVKYNDLFKDQGDKVSDIKKLITFFESPKLKNEFITQVADILNLDLCEITLIGGVNSLPPKTNNSKYVVPDTLVHLSTLIKDEIAKIDVVSLPIIAKDLFTIKSCVHEL